MINRIAIDYFAPGYGDNQELIYFIIIYIVIICIVGVMHLYFFKLAGQVEMGFAYDLREKCFYKLHSLIERSIHGREIIRCKYTNW